MSALNVLSLRLPSPKAPHLPGARLPENAPEAASENSARPAAVQAQKSAGDNFERTAERGSKAAVQPPELTPLEKQAAAVTKAIESGDLLELAALIEESKSPEERQKKLETRNKAAETPLLQAVSQQSPAAVGMLLYLGANAKASDAKGYNPLFKAASVGDARIVKLLVEHPKASAAQHDNSLWRSPKVLKQTLQAFIARGKLSPTAIDNAARGLTGAKASIFKDGMQLQKYATHLESMKQNPWGVSAEGWNSGSFFEQRARSLVALLCEPKHLGDAAKGDPQGVRDCLYFELGSTLEGLRVRRRNMAMAKIDNPELRQQLVDVEAKNIVNRIANMPQGFEYIIPGGWVGHATYLNVSRRVVDGEEVFTVRKDNRGGGSRRHEHDGNHIYPYVMNVPAKAMARPEIQKTLQAMIGAQLLLKVGPSDKGNADTLYDGFDTTKAQLIAEFGPIVVRQSDRSHEKLSKQTAGNCVVENANAGLRERLGPALADAVIDAEKTLVHRRLLEEVFTAANFERFVKANRQRIAEVLTQDSTS